MPFENPVPFSHSCIGQAPVLSCTWQHERSAHLDWSTSPDVCLVDKRILQPQICMKNNLPAMSLQALTKRFSLRREKPARARKTKSDDPPAYTVKSKNDRNVVTVLISPEPSNLSLWRQANKSALSYKQFSDHFHKYTQGTLLPCEAREMDVRVIEGVLRMTECGTVKTKSEMLNFNFHIDPFGRCPEQSSKTQLTVYLLWVYTDNETDTAAHGKVRAPTNGDIL